MQRYRESRDSAGRLSGSNGSSDGGGHTSTNPARFTTANTVFTFSYSGFKYRFTSNSVNSDISDFDLEYKHSDDI